MRDCVCFRLFASHSPIRLRQATHLPFHKQQTSPCGQRRRVLPEIAGKIRHARHAPPGSQGTRHDGDRTLDEVPESYPDVRIPRTAPFLSFFLKLRVRVACHSSAKMNKAWLTPWCSMARSLPRNVASLTARKFEKCERAIFINFS